MSKFTDFLVNIVLPTFETLGESGLVKVLQKFKEQNPEQYEVSLRAGHTFIKPLLAFVAETETKVDDGIAEAINESINLSASANGIVFTDEAEKA